jgi:hypothetical protein
MNIWILTSELNEYDQYGEYYICAFKEKPSLDIIQRLLNVTSEYATHILEKGGRLDTEYKWYNLREEDI